jgi:hypothetical protein
VSQTGFNSRENDRPRSTSELAQLIEATQLFCYSPFTEDVAVLKLRFELFAFSNGRKNDYDREICLLISSYFKNSINNSSYIQATIDINSQHSLRDSNPSR